MIERFFKRSINNPNVPVGQLLDLFGSKSATGATVTPENSLESTAVWSAIRLISSTIATLPLPVYRATEAGKEKARRHPLYRILHDRPNPEQSSFVFRELLQAWLLLYGNAYAEIERNGRGDPVGLWPIHPTQVRIERDSQKRKLYVVRVDGVDVPVSRDNILHIPGFSLDGCQGLIPIHLLRNAIGLTKATEDFGSRFFSNGAQPGGVLSHPGKLGTEAAERLRKSWSEAHQGLTNAQRVAILEEGMKFEPLGIAPEHAQFLETRKFQIAEIARIFLIPPHLLADLERATFSNIEHQAIQYVTHCIEPWARRIEQELNAALFGGFDRNPEYFAEFVLDGLLRGDSKSRAEFYTALFNIGVLSPNDIRERENMNRVEGGDTRYVPLNMAPLGADAVTEAARALIDAEVGRYVRRYEKHLERGNVDEEFYRRNEAILLENLGPTLTAYFRLTGSSDNPAEYIRRIVRNQDLTNAV